MMLSILPAVGAIFSVLFIMFYPLTEKKVKEITKDLNEKRQV